MNEYETYRQWNPIFYHTDVSKGAAECWKKSLRQLDQQINVPSNDGDTMDARRRPRHRTSGTPNVMKGAGSPSPTRDVTSLDYWRRVRSLSRETRQRQEARDRQMQKQELEERRRREQILSERKKEKDTLMIKFLREPLRQRRAAKAAKTTAGKNSEDSMRGGRRGGGAGARDEGGGTGGDVRTSQSVPDLEEALRIVRGEDRVLDARARAFLSPYQRRRAPREEQVVCDRFLRTHSRPPSQYHSPGPPPRRVPAPPTRPFPPGSTDDIIRENQKPYPTWPPEELEARTRQLRSKNVGESGYKMGTTQVLSDTFSITSEERDTESLLADYRPPLDSHIMVLPRPKLDRRSSMPDLRDFRCVSSAVVYETIATLGTLGDARGLLVVPPRSHQDDTKATTNTTVTPPHIHEANKAGEKMQKNSKKWAQKMNRFIESETQAVLRASPLLGALPTSVGRPDSQKGRRSQRKEWVSKHMSMKTLQKKILPTALTDSSSQTESMDSIRHTSLVHRRRNSLGSEGAESVYYDSLEEDESKNITQRSANQAFYVPIKNVTSDLDVCPTLPARLTARMEKRRAASRRQPLPDTTSSLALTGKRINDVLLDEVKLAHTIAREESRSDQEISSSSQKNNLNENAHITSDSDILDSLEAVDIKNTPLLVYSSECTETSYSDILQLSSPKAANHTGSSNTSINRQTSKGNAVTSLIQDRIHSNPTCSPHYSDTYTSMSGESTPASNSTDDQTSRRNIAVKEYSPRQVEMNLMNDAKDESVTEPRLPVNIRSSTEKKEVVSRRDDSGATMTSEATDRIMSNLSLSNNIINVQQTQKNDGAFTEMNEKSGHVNPEQAGPDDDDYDTDTFQSFSKTNDKSDSNRSEIIRTIESGNFSDKNWSQSDVDVIDNSSIVEENDIISVSDGVGEISENLITENNEISDDEFLQTPEEVKEESCVDKTQEQYEIIGYTASGKEVLLESGFIDIDDPSFSSDSLSIGCDQDKQTALPTTESKALIKDVMQKSIDIITKTQSVCNVQVCNGREVLLNSPKYSNSQGSNMAEMQDFGDEPQNEDVGITNGNSETISREGMRKDKCMQKKDKQKNKSIEEDEECQSMCSRSKQEAIYNFDGEDSDNSHVEDAGHGSGADTTVSATTDPLHPDSVKGSRESTKSETEVIKHEMLSLTTERRDVQILTPRTERRDVQILTPRTDLGDVQVLTPRTDLGDVQVLTPRTDLGEEQVLTPRTDLGEEQVLTPRTDLGDVQVLTPRTDLGEEQVLTLRTYLGEEQVLTPRIDLGEEQVTPRTDLGEEQVLTPRTDLGEEQILTPRTDLGEEQVLTPRTDLGEDQVITPRTDLGEVQVLTPRTDLGEEQVLTPRTHLGEEQVLTPRTDLGEVQVLTPRTDLGEVQVLTPRTDLGEVQVLTPRTDLGEEQVLTPRTDLGEEQVLTPRTDLGEEQEITPRTDLEDVQVLTPRTDLGEEQVLTPRTNLGEEQVITPRTDLGEQVLTPRTDLGEEQVLTHRTDLGEEQLLTPRTDLGEEQVLTPRTDLREEQVLTPRTVPRRTEVLSPTIQPRRKNTLNPGAEPRMEEQVLNLDMGTWEEQVLNTGKELVDVEIPNLATGPSIEHKDEEHMLSYCIELREEEQQLSPGTEASVKEPEAEELSDGTDSWDRVTVIRALSGSSSGSRNLTPDIDTEFILTDSPQHEEGVEELNEFDDTCLQQNRSLSPQETSAKTSLPDHNPDLLEEIFRVITTDDGKQTPVDETNSGLSTIDEDEEPTEVAALLQQEQVTLMADNAAEVLHDWVVDRENSFAELKTDNADVNKGTKFGQVENCKSSTVTEDGESCVLAKEDRDKRQKDTVAVDGCNGNTLVEEDKNNVVDKETESINMMEGGEAYVVAEQGEASVVTEQDEASVDTEQGEGSIVAEQDDAFIVAEQGEASVATEQDEASVVTEQGEASIVTEQDDAFIVAEQGEASVVTEQDEASVVTEQGEASIVTEQDDAFIVAEQGEASVVTEQGAGGSIVLEEVEDPIVVEEGEEFIVVEEAEDSIVVERTEDSIVVEEDEDSIVVEGAEDSVVVEGVADSVVVEDAEDFIVGEGAEDSIVVEEAGGPIVVEGEDSSVVEVAEDSIVVEGGEDSIVVEGAEDSIVVEGEDSVVIEEAEDSIVVEGEDSVVLEEAEDSIVVEEDEDSIVVEGAEDSVVVEGTGGSIVVEGAEDSIVVEEAGGSIVVEGEDYSVVEVAEDSIVVEGAGNSIVVEGEDSVVIEEAEDSIVVEGEDSIVIEGAEDSIVVEGEDSIVIEVAEDSIVVEGEDSIVIEGAEDSIVVEGEDSIVVEVAEDSIMVEGAEDSIVVAGEDSIVVEVAEDSIMVKGAEDSIVVEGAEDSILRILEGAEDSIVVEGAEDSIQVEGAEDSIVVEGEDSIVIEEAEDSIVIEVAEDSIVVEGAEDSIVVEGVDSFVIEEAEDSIVVEEPEDSVVVEEDEDSIVVEGAEDSIVVEGAEDSIVVEEAEDSIVVDGAEDSVVVEEAEDSIVVEGAEDSIVVEVAEDSIVIEGAEDSIVVEGAEDYVVVEGAEDSIVVEGAEDSVVVEGTEDSVVVEGAEDSVVRELRILLW
ncbi:uncharacterized protein LOC121872227 [Homarus americanus]|uniref:uncharacterized protein LOC121872227 n=1 Tax=Homarus americanus TaxID=6706 RepID=UPI001C494F2F|nr:uncharacterized protein LOC121872227 [Homarus americanus]